MKVLLKHIDVLWLASKTNEEHPQVRMNEPPRLENAFVLIQDDRIVEVGTMQDLNINESSCDLILDVNGRHVLPGFCDSHTHVVFASSRENEFVDKIRGLTYEEIARRGGGILNSAQILGKTSEEDLFEAARARIEELMSYGTTSLEIKSGYGLTTEAEIKMLRVIRRLKENLPIPIKATFLGAHAFPAAFKQNPDAYVDLIIHEMLPEIAKENLADYVDVFCDRGFFTPEQTARILEAAGKFDLKPKIHANELGHTGGVQVGVQHKAVSVDHLEHLSDEEIDLLKHSSTIPTALPGTSFFLKLPYAPLRKMVDAGLPLALASDFNPGSCPSGNMQFVWSLACIYGGLLPEEALVALTLHGAKAMELDKEVGFIAPKRKANLLITRHISSLAAIPYYFARNNIEQVFVNGKPIKSI